MAWTIITDLLGAARYGAIGFGVGTKGYVGLGRNARIPIVRHNDLWEYNTTTGSWSQKANLPGEGRYGSVVFTLGTKAYVCLGANSTTELVDMYEYDTATNQWAIKIPFPAQGRRFAVGFGIGTRGYIGTGVTLGGSTTAAFFAFVPSENSGMGKWYSMPSFSSVGRHSAVGFTVNNKGYVGLGTLSNGTFTDEFYEYNPLTNQWIAKDDYGGGGRTASTCFVTTGNKAYVGLGYYSVPVSSGMNGDFWEFDPTLGLGSQWTKVFSFIGANRHTAIGFGVGTKGYVGTGTTGDVELKDFYVLDPATNATVENILTVRWDITASNITVTNSFAWDIKDLTDTLPYVLDVGWNIEKYTYTAPISIETGWDLFNWFQYPDAIALSWNIDVYYTTETGITTSWAIGNYADIRSDLNVVWNIKEWEYLQDGLLCGWDMFEYNNIKEELDCEWTIFVFYNTPDFVLESKWDIDDYLNTPDFVLECKWDISAYQDIDVSADCSWNVQSYLDTDLFELDCAWNVGGNGYHEATLECVWDMFEGVANAYYSTSNEFGWDVTANTISNYINSVWDIANYTTGSIVMGWDIATLGKVRYEFDSEERLRVFKKEIIRKKQ